jgi:hypothetical protein
MNQSKYNPKLDPKSTAYQPQTAKASVEVPVTAANVTKLRDPALAEKYRQDAKAHYQGSPAAVQAVASVDEKSSSAMISEGGNPVAGNTPHAVQEPSSLTGDLPPTPEAHAVSEGGEKAAAISAKPLT